jgi:hypothetical protein
MWTGNPEPWGWMDLSPGHLDRSRPGAQAVAGGSDVQARPAVGVLAPANCVEEGPPHLGRHGPLQ